jgi:hypothetical protein
MHLVTFSKPGVIFYHELAVINEHEPHSLSKLKTHYSYEKIYMEVIVVDKI